jgi:hypothetical protein
MPMLQDKDKAGSGSWFLYSALWPLLVLVALTLTLTLVAWFCGFVVLSIAIVDRRTGFWVLVLALVLVLLRSFLNQKATLLFEKPKPKLGIGEYCDYQAPFLIIPQSPKQHPGKTPESRSESLAQDQGGGRLPDCQ